MTIRVTAAMEREMRASILQAVRDNPDASFDPPVVGATTHATAGDDEAVHVEVTYPLVG